MKFPELVECLHPTQAKSLELRLSSLEPLNGGNIQIRVCKIGLVIFEYEYIRVYLSIISECRLFMKAPGHEADIRLARTSSSMSSSAPKRAPAPLAARSTAMAAGASGAAKDAIPPREAGIRGR